MDDKELVSEILEAARRLDKGAQELLLWCAKALERNRGGITPAEELLTQLLIAYKAREGWIAPLDVNDSVQQYREAIEDLVAVHSEVLKKYQRWESHMNAERKARGSAGAN